MSDIMFSAAPFVDEMIVPLKHIGISFFSFTRIFDDGSVVDFNNHPDMANKFYYGDDQLYLDYIPERTPFALGSNISFLNTMVNNRTVRFLREQCGIDNMCVIIEKGIGYTDVYNYGTNPKDSFSPEIYIKNMERIKSFAFFSKDKLSQDIIEFSKKPIEICKTPKKNSSITSDGLSLDVPRYYIGYENRYLTKRQFNCCRLIKQGKSPEEIAIIMQVSIGVCRNYINEIKDIFEAEHIYQLMAMLHGMALI